MISLLVELQNRLSDFEIIKITETNYKQLADIYDSNEDFFILTEGEKSTVESCLTDINSIPPGYDLSKKLFFSCWFNGRAVAVADVLAGFPSPNILWIGLLLIHGDWKRRQIGRKITKALVDSAGALGMARVQLGVIENNLAGLVFWSRMGFIKIKETQIKTSAGKSVNVMVYGFPP